MYIFNRLAGDEILNLDASLCSSSTSRPPLDDFQQEFYMKVHKCSEVNDLWRLSHLRQATGDKDTPGDTAGNEQVLKRSDVFPLRRAEEGDLDPE